jgi:hypothetical protein
MGIKKANAESYFLAVLDWRFGGASDRLSMTSRLKLTAAFCYTIEADFYLVLY